MQDTEFAVVDVETTGLFPEQHDRIIEIAVVRIDQSGKTLTEYATLVNPLRDIGPSYLHGITSRDVTNAPEFSEIAGDALHAISPRLVDRQLPDGTLENESGGKGNTTPYKWCLSDLARQLLEETQVLKLGGTDPGGS